jgi:glucokinase
MVMAIYLGVDVGGTNTTCGLVEDGVILESATVKTGQSPDALEESVAEAVTSALSRRRLTLEGADGIGVGIPAFMNPRTGRYRFPNIPGGEDVDFGRMLSERLKRPVVIGNDADFTSLGAASHIGEFTPLKEGPGSRGLVELVLLTIGTGIGGGVVLKCGKTRMVLSGRGGLTELGHMKVVDDPQYLCGCGKVGCVEATSSCTGQVNAVSRRLENSPDIVRNAFPREFTSEDIDRLSDEGNTLAHQVMESAGKHLGFAASNILNAFNPSVLAFSGGGAKSKTDGTFFKALFKALEENTLPEAWDAVAVVKNPDAKRYGIYGAAHAATETL